MSNVKLVSWTQPSLELRDSGINDLTDLVAYCARVSNPDNQLNTETSERLINYMIKHSHWSPFEMVSLTLEIKTTRDIGRQILRHRSFAFQEFSQRYAKVIEDTLREARLQDSKNRQHSIDLPVDNTLQKTWDEFQERVSWIAEGAYAWALQNNIAKEVARAVLPEGMTITTMYMTGSLRSWIHYCQLRCQMNTQKEHRGVAEKCVDEISKVFPMMKELISETT